MVLGRFVSAIKELKKKAATGLWACSIKTEVASIFPQFFNFRSAAQTLFGLISSDSYFIFFFVPVSLSLCQIPPPSQDLVGKYMTLKEKFLSRLENLKLMDKIQKLIEQSGKEQVVKEYVQFMDPNLRLQAAENFVK